MGQETEVRKTFLRSLLHDRTANTIAIAAAAMFPVLAMVGGGIDASRYYMAASRMQAACDAGALAARRAMVDDDFEPEHRIIGENFFDQNYTENMFGTEDRVRTFTDDGTGRVDGAASGTLPTTLMAAFGYDELNLAVTCSAEINISNTDIMFVLDVTGSMNCPETQLNPCPGNGNNGNTEVANSLIVGLRAAVLDFYDTVDDATSSAAQVRYGAVPYAANVNVGFSIPRQFMSDSHSYQSRVARFREQFTFIPGNGVRVGDLILISNQVEQLPRNTANFGSTNNDLYRFRGSPAADRNAARTFCRNTLRNTFTVGSQRWQISATEFSDNVWTDGNENNRSGCRGMVRKTRTATAADVIADQTIRTVVPDGYTYCRVTPGVANQCGTNNPAGSPAGWEAVNLRTLYADNRIQMPTGVNGAMQNLTWNGCIEEANTVATGTWNPVNPNAFDLNVNLIPGNDAQRWKPMLVNAVWKRFNAARARTTNNVVTNNTNGYEAAADVNFPATVTTHECPAAARPLATTTRAELQTYVNGLRPRGSTYHDLGMIWGARFISPNGIFRAANEVAPNGDAIARHIVFMTDGLPQSSIEQYGTYGMEFWNRRVTDDGVSNQTARHTQRFLAACRAAQNEGITVWVVSFGLPRTPELIECASPGRSYDATNNAALSAAFEEIAQKIAALRLTS